MVDSHSHLQSRELRHLRTGVLFACWLPLVVLVSWLVAFRAADSFDVGLLLFAVYVGFTATLLAPAGLVFAIRAHRSTHTVANRYAVMGALIGNVLVIAQVLVIVAVAGYQIYLR